MDENEIEREGYYTITEEEEEVCVARCPKKSNHTETETFQDEKNEFVNEREWKKTPNNLCLQLLKLDIITQLQHHPLASPDIRNSVKKTVWERRKW